MAEYRTTLLQKILSYFTDVKIESVYSDFNSTLDVIFAKGRFQLNSANATYSFEDLYTSYGGALKKIHPQKEKLNSVLVLGLGLASIPYMLQTEYEINCIIDCVEIDPLIIDLAQKYYPSSVGFSKLRIHHSDAFEWILQNNKKFDLITVDLFVDRDVPKKLHQKEFIEGLKNALEQNGIILFSRLKSNKPVENKLWENLFEVFPGGQDIETMGNAIFHWENK